MLNARRGIRGRELMSVSSSRARARARPRRGRYRDANARDSADHPHNESTLRREILPVRLSLAFSLSLSLSLSRAVSVGFRLGFSRRVSLSLFLSLSFSTPPPPPRRFYYCRRLPERRYLMKCHRCPTDRRRVICRRFLIPCPFLAASEISRFVVRARNAPEMTATATIKSRR